MYILLVFASPGNQTHDLGVTSIMLYQLSYEYPLLRYRPSLCSLFLQCHYTWTLFMSAHWLFWFLEASADSLIHEFISPSLCLQSVNYITILSDTHTRTDSPPPRSSTALPLAGRWQYEQRVLYSHVRSVAICIASLRSPPRSIRRSRRGRMTDMSGLWAHLPHFFPLYLSRSIRGSLSVLHIEEQDPIRRFHQVSRLSFLPLLSVCLSSFLWLSAHCAAEMLRHSNILAHKVSVGPSGLHGQYRRSAFPFSHLIYTS